MARQRPAIRSGAKGGMTGLGDVVTIYQHFLLFSFGSPACYLLRFLHQPELRCGGGGSGDGKRSKELQSSSPGPITLVWVSRWFRFVCPVWALGLDGADGISKQSGRDGKQRIDKQGNGMKRKRKRKRFHALPYPTNPFHESSFCGL